jgi:hypothetical protein
LILTIKRKQRKIFSLLIIVAGNLDIKQFYFIRIIDLLIVSFAISTFRGRTT